MDWKAAGGGTSGTMRIRMHPRLGSHWQAGVLAAGKKCLPRRTRGRRSSGEELREKPAKQYRQAQRASGLKTLGDVPRASSRFPLEAARRSLLESGIEGDREGQERGNEPLQAGSQHGHGATWSDDVAGMLAAGVGLVSV